jgi:hypothetical protein
MTKTEKTTGRMPNAALMKPVQPDDALAVIVGSTPLPFGQAAREKPEYPQQARYEMPRPFSGEIAMRVSMSGGSNSVVNPHVRQRCRAASLRE